MVVDYEKLGFKAGIEIHQQLDTGKLFCNCPGVLRSDEPLFEVSRKLHLVSGESGEIDVAAKYQHLEDKTFVYQGNDTTCLVELDEEPPHKINQEALYIALQIGELLNCKIIPMAQVMRKTVINGSNTSGFQRTVMFARDGFVETSRGKVGISFILLEEDSARPVSREKDRVVYKLDRLGLPLVEVVTAPDIKDAAHAKETALKIGEILRSCKVRRGIGTIRQDINISVKGSNRVEIKGFQDPKIMELCVDNEILRQKGLLDLSKEIFKVKIGDIKEVSLAVELEWMKKAIKGGAKFVGCSVKGYEGLFGRELFSGYRLGTDLARYAKTRGFGGVIHSDEDLVGKYKFSSEDIARIKKEFGASSGDAFLMVLGDKVNAEKMFKEVLFPRMLKLNEPNSSEVRNCLPDATTEFLRPMPGSARMYPETDLEILHIHRDLINKAKKNLPELRSVVEARLKKEGLSEDMITILFKRDKFEDFKAISSVVGHPKVVGKILLLLTGEIAAKTDKDITEVEEILDVEVLTFVMEELVKGKIDEGDLKMILEKIVNGVSALEAVKVEKVDSSEIEGRIAVLIKDKPGLRPNAYMGIIMKEFDGKVQAGEVMKIIGKILG
ncbi:MAG: Glu-tRNA(Gln) amidotransferase subunit GatE [Nanoarchaeota archaeon]|jgi:glutamyl-tRNA(Gln) amidotransferase subunit E|nr:Glu-tRNA(Gln) amidotransferase subunit GatE [Nanoarchaeota archaeon]